MVHHLPTARKLSVYGARLFVAITETEKEYVSETSSVSLSSVALLLPPLPLCNVQTLLVKEELLPTSTISLPFTILTGVCVFFYPTVDIICTCTQ